MVAEDTAEDRAVVASEEDTKVSKIHALVGNSIHTYVKLFNTWNSHPLDVLFFYSAIQAHSVVLIILAEN